jgi:hypothetical protein
MTTTNLEDVDMSGALQSSDGKFYCTPEHAVEVAYMLSTAEAVLDRAPFDSLEMGGLLIQYLRGSLSVDDAQKELQEWFKDVTP